MPIDPSSHIEPETTALIALEVQENLLFHDRAMIPGLAAHAHTSGLIPRLSQLYGEARRVGVPMYYVVTGSRQDPAAGGTATVGRSMTPGTRAAGHGPIVAELAPRAGDITITREVGMTGFYASPLDTYLRAAGVRSVIITGVSANIAVTGTAIEAMNRGYRVVIVSDGIAGDPPEYVEQLLRYTLRNVGLVVPAQSVIDAWSRSQQASAGADTGATAQAAVGATATVAP